MARKKLIHIEVSRGYEYPAGLPAKVNIKTVCGHLPATDTYTTTTYPGAADCVRCLARFRKVIPPVGKCAECNAAMLIVDGYAVCPHGHGKLVPIKRGDIGAAEVVARTITVKPVSRMAREITEGQR